MKQSAALMSSALALLVAACGAARDPAKEPEAKLKPGQYKIGFSGETMGFAMPKGQGPGTKDQIVCLAAEDIDGWPKPLVRSAMSVPEQYCTFEDDSRLGNFLKGKMTCEADQEKAPGGSFSLSYEGNMTETSTKLNTKMSMNIVLPPEVVAKDPEQAKSLAQGMEAMKNLTIVIKAERLGDCQ